MTVEIDCSAIKCILYDLRYFCDDVLDIITSYTTLPCNLDLVKEIVKKTKCDCFDLIIDKYFCRFSREYLTAVGSKVALHRRYMDIFYEDSYVSSVDFKFQWKRKRKHIIIAVIASGVINDHTLNGLKVDVCNFDQVLEKVTEYFSKLGRERRFADYVTVVIFVALGLTHIAKYKPNQQHIDSFTRFNLDEL